MKTSVLFLIEKDSEDEVFAYFPDMPFNSMAETCYSHIGQHAACNILYASACNKATPDQYADLKRELERIGYELEILN